VKKTRSLLFLIVAAVLLLSACGGGSNDKQSDKSNKSYDRIISLMPSNTEILYKLGLGKKIVGVSTVDDYPKDVKNKKKFNAMKLNKEALLKAKARFNFSA
jgi:iron complex transport system substrate-binding protein